MIEDMTIRKFAPKTQHDYVQRVKNFSVSGDRPIQQASRTYAGTSCIWRRAALACSTLNQTVSTLRFFFKVTLRRHDIVEHTHVIHEPRKLPVVLSPEESGAAARCRRRAQIQGGTERGCAPPRWSRSRFPTLTASE